MSKELMIVFVYDTYKNDEFADPVKSVVYFHPTWVSETQKLLLCGQIMGTTHFLGETLFNPRMITLQSGKFAIKSFGRFVMAVGSDRNISEVVLEHRANFLHSLLKLYHCDINTIYKQSNATGQQTKFADKLYGIIESYLPLLQFNGNIFQNVSSFKIPRSASNMYLEATQILQSFQQTKGILGGTIFYHNKVVASQLSDNLTKIFTLSDLYRLKTSEYVPANYHIPVGVTLINAYISIGDYENLERSSTQSHNLFQITVSKDIIPFHVRKKSISKDLIIKKDKSLIFTNIPEEDMEEMAGTFKSVNSRKPCFSRPTHLPLLYKNPAAMGAAESGFNSINFDETDSFPNFIGKTSICSTPMTENKLLPNGNVLSICAASESIDIDRKAETLDQNKAIACDSKEEFKNDDTRKSRSLNFNNHILLSLPNLDKFKSEAVESVSKTTTPNKKKRKSNFRNTIADPTYPIFNENGILISHCLFQKFVKFRYNDLKKCANASILNGNYSVNKEEDSESFTSNTDIVVKEELNNVFSTVQTKKSRFGLNLPLKSLNIESNAPQQQRTSAYDGRKLTGLQLTPLMSKLTLLAFSDQQSSGFSSWDTTPGCSSSLNNQMTPMDYQPKRRKSITFNSADSIGEGFEQDALNHPVKVELFICVQQNMTLVLLLEEKSCEKKEMIHSLFETCVSKLTKMENNLHQVLSINVEGSSKGDGGYSFICLDSKWDVNNRCGPWTPGDLLTLNLMHNDLHSNRKLFEFIIRSQDAVIYGYRCGRSEFYYQESSIKNPGLPPPQDAMGTVSLCAKRRLERDHRILLL